MTDVPTPPADPDEWSDEQWITYLEATADNDFASGGTAVPGAMQRVAASQGGRLVGEAMMGLAMALYGSVDKPAIIAEAPGSGHDEELIVELDADNAVARIHHRDGTGPITSDTGPHAPDTGPHAPDTGPHAPDTGPQVPDTGSHAPDTGPHAPDTGPQVPDPGPTS